MNPRRAGMVLAVAWLAGCTVTPGPLPSAPGTPSPTAATVAQPERCTARGELPDPACTPGALNPAVDADAPAYAATICKSGWTATIRPPTSYTNALKRWQLLGDPKGRERATVARYLHLDPAAVTVGVYGRYGGGDSVGDYEEDHLVSLALGGAPADPANLWPEFDDSPNPKDGVEVAAQRWICRGKVGDRPARLATARRLIAGDWRQLAVVVGARE